MEKLAPRQHVSAFVSQSLSAIVPGGGEGIVGCAAIPEILLLVVKTLEIVLGIAGASQLVLLRLKPACSFLPHIILDLVAWET